VIALSQGLKGSGHIASKIASELGDLHAVVSFTRSCTVSRFSGSAVAGRKTGGAMNHLAPAYVPPEDAGLFRVSEPGWYAFDDDHNAVLGPFNSDEECVEAIKSRRE
jgi:hypothetical protein